MRRYVALLALAWLLGALPACLLAQANLPNNPNAATVQGPDPSGQLGYPVATVPALGALPWPVAIQSFAAAVLVNQNTFPWFVAADPSDDPWRVTFNGITQPVTCSPSPSNDPWRVGFAGIAQPVNATQSGGWTVGFGGLAQPVNATQSGGWTVGFGGVKQPVTNEPLANVAVIADGNKLQRIARDSGAANLYHYTIPIYWDGVQAALQRTPANFNTVATAAAGNTVLWTPAAGKKFRLMRYLVTVVDQATQAAPGTVTISLFDGAAGATGQVHDVFVPALGLVNSGSLYTSGWIDLGNGYLSANANQVLNVNLSAALTAGTVRVICCGTEE